MNFLALMVIAELDDYFYVAHGYILPKQMVQHQDSTYAQLYMIHTTSSVNAGAVAQFPDVNKFELSRADQWVKRQLELEKKE